MTGSQGSIEAVLLIAFGGPTAPAEIRPFLENVARGRRIPPERLEAVAHHYEAMPEGRSPLNDLTFMQARSLQAMLTGVNLNLPVFVGMRNWTPYLADTLETLAARVHDAEHRLYPATVRRLLTEPWRREGSRVIFGPAPAGANVR